MIYKQERFTLKNILAKEREKKSFRKLMHDIETKRKKKNIYPTKENVFAAFTGLCVKDVKVVILGQDPYHTEGMATGSAFAVAKGCKIPPSLRNIYKEMKNDLGKEPKDLNELKKEGVLLLNIILTVEEGSPLSHKNIGWEGFTDEVLCALWKRKEKIVFLLWGNQAKKKGKELFKGGAGHLILESGHPSPLSARFFFGCRHFSKANAFLKKKREKIDWCKE